MTTTLAFQLDAPEATQRLAGCIADFVQPGDVVLLSGDLGAGKTTLVRALAIGLGVDAKQISSPTFTVMNEYTGGRIDPIIHMDAYRLEGGDEGELLELGWDDALRAHALTLIEWGERIEDVLEHMLDCPPIRIRLAHAHADTRTARVILPSEAADRPANEALRTLQARFAPVDTDRPGYPFATERDQLVDLYHWFGESYRVTRPVEETDDDATP